MTRLAGLIVAVGLVVAATDRLVAQRGGGPPPPQGPAREIAPIDLTGYWVSIVTQDWRWRMVTPAPGDYGRIPLNEEGQRVADTWDPAAPVADACVAYGAPALMSVPGRLHITWEDDETLRVDTDAGMQTRLLRFNGADAPAGEPPSRQGHSAAEWQIPRGNVPVVLRPATRTAGESLLPEDRGGSLRVVTTNLLEGYLRKNGVPYSGEAVLTEYWDLFTHPNGDVWLTITTEVEDPVYLRQPRLIAIPFRREPDGANWDPMPCSAT